MSVHTSLHTIELDTETLTGFLKPLLSNENLTGDQITIHSKTPFAGKGTYPVEIVDCSAGHQRYLLFCKHGNKLLLSSSRPGIDHERRMYEQVLAGTTCTTIKFYGSFGIDERNEVWLVFDYIHDAGSLRKSNLDDYVKAASWAGQFHRYFESKPIEFIKSYDNAFYEQWVDYVEPLAEEIKDRYSWLPSLCNYYLRHLDELVNTTQTLTHGEYYGKNILKSKEVIYPVDWEKAAYGAGEIDLAALLDKFNEAPEKVIESYISSRWPERNFSQAAFEKRLLLAQLYFRFRWICSRKIDGEVLAGWMAKSYGDEFYQLAKKAGVV